MQAFEDLLDRFAAAAGIEQAPRDPIACQTRRCDGDMSDEDALRSLRDYGKALCACCREEAARDGCIDDSISRAKEGGR